MTQRSTRRAVMVVSLLLCAAWFLPSMLRAASSKDQAALRTANQRWSGARCRSLQEITAKKGKPGDWTKCKLLFYGKGGNHRVRVLVSDGSAVHRAFYGGTLPIGTEFVASGWAVDDGGDLHLDLELTGHPVRVRVYYGDDWVGRVSLGRLDDFERWARFELFELLSVPSEQLVDAPVSAAASESQPVIGSTTPATPAPQPAITTEPSAPKIKVLAVAAQPTRVAPGGEIAMVITYEVSGVPPGPGFEVVERREILHGAQRFAVFEERLARSNDIFTSRQPLRLPPDVGSGIYTLWAEVEMAGSEATGSALFEVVTTP